MPLYRDRIYPRLVSSIGNPKPIRSLRRRLVPLAAGTVLEVGVGAGANLPFYDPERVTLLYALEPNPGMRRLAAAEQCQAGLKVEFIDLPGERLPLADASVDTVVSTFTLCTIANLAEALRGIKRVLKPGGRLLFLELSVAADPRVRRWQRLWEPIHYRLFEGLHLTRDIPQLLQQAGLETQDVDSVWLTPFPRSWAHCCMGTAIAGI